MLLVAHELYASGLKQKINVLENTNCISVRPHLYKHLSSVGSLKLQLLDVDQKIIDESSSLVISTISSANYFHGYVRFDCNFRLKANQTYWIKLLGIGYTFSESAYIGWCNDYDLRKVDANYSRNQGYFAALDMEIWENRQVSWSDT